MKLRNVEEAILRFEPVNQDHALNTPAGHGVDYTLLKDLVLDHINSLQKINLKLGASSEIAAKLGELKAAYETVFGHPVLDEINEGYADNVSAVANRVIERSQSTPFTKEELLRAIEREAGYVNVPEIRFKDSKSKAWPDFVRDVLAAVKGKVKFSRPGVAAAATERKEREKRLLRGIAQIIEHGVSENFPDGDTTDYIWPRVQRLGIPTDEIGKWVDRAARTELGMKSFDDYIGTLYDDYFADNPKAALHFGYRRNPYTGKPIDYAKAVANVVNSDPQMVIDVLSDRVLAQDPKILATVADNKDTIVKALLKRIKDKPASLSAKRVVNHLLAAGMAWPELELIKKSIDPSQIAEDIRPGDVFMIESTDQAIVGTVLSFDNNTLIIEGDSFLFNTEELEENQRHAHTFRVKPEEFRNMLHNGLSKFKHTYKGDVLIVYTSDPRAEAELEAITGSCQKINEAEYQGREVKLGKPMPGDVKKYKVFVRDPKTGNVKKVNFGDRGMEIKRDDPERRKSFRARHGCGTSRASDRTKAAYWSCRMWSSKPVGDILKGK